MDIRFGTWNVRSLYRKGFLTTVARELGKYKLDLVGVQEVRWEKGGTERAEDYTFFYGQGNGDRQLRTGFFVHKRIVSAVRRVEFISDRMLYILLRGRWSNIVVLNVHATCEDKGGDEKDSYYEELGRVFDQFRRYNTKIILDDFKAQVCRKKISNQRSETTVYMKLIMKMELE
jgi:exonuclease III